MTGVFTIPAGTAPQRMPGLRPYLLIDAGVAFGPEWERVFGPKRLKRRREGSITAGSESGERGEKHEDRATIAGPPYEYAARSTSRLTHPANDDGEDPFRDHGEGEVVEEDVDDYSARAWKIVESMKEEEAWWGTSYSLLSK
jgi:hypothetical protein